MPPNREQRPPSGGATATAARMRHDTAASHDQPVAADRFVVVAAPRTGSNWLCSLLDSHPEILCHHEIFNPERILYSVPLRENGFSLGTIEERNRDPLGFLQRVWRQDRGHAFLGIKVNRGQEQSIREHVLAARAIKKIVLRRRNQVRTFVSEKIAQQTGVWEHYTWSDSPDRRPTVAVDPEELLTHAAMNRQYFDEIFAALERSGQTWLDLFYEDLNLPETRERILRYLGVNDASADLMTLTAKQETRALRHMIANYDALRDSLAGTELAADLAAH